MISFGLCGTFGGALDRRLANLAIDNQSATVTLWNG